MADVEIGLGAVVGDEDLAVLERVHRAGVDVEIGVELLHRDAQTPGLQQVAEAGGRETLAEGGGDAPGDEEVLGRRPDCRSAGRPTRAPVVLVCGGKTHLSTGFDRNSPDRALGHAMQSRDTRRVLPVSLARRLHDAGLRWTPGRGDRFVLTDREMDDEVFVLSDMTVEVHDFPHRPRDRLQRRDRVGSGLRRAGPGAVAAHRRSAA